MPVIPDGRVWRLVPTCLMTVAVGVTSDGQGVERLRDHVGGMGVVGREIAGEVICAPNASGLRTAEVFESIGGPTVGTFEWRAAEHGGCSAFLVRGGDRTALYRSSDLPELSYEAVGLAYYAERDGYARVLERTVPPGLWLRIADVSDGTLRSWAEWLLRPQLTYLWYDGYPLHSEPSESSPVLVSLRERRVHESRVHQLVPTGAVSGVWGEFEVIEFDGEFVAMARTREPIETGNRWKGWLRLVDGLGAPLFWYFTRD